MLAKSSGFLLPAAILLATLSNDAHTISYSRGDDDSVGPAAHRANGPCSSETMGF